ncbi:MAG: HEAT repeat domain-containing protein [Gemmataceae bacterium]|nr:HEAT repeat domain-containing protein [Gemmataceae bacterium]
MSDLYEGLLREKAKIRQLQEELNSRFRTLAGPNLDRMIHSREFTETCLQHGDSNERCAAICLMVDHWNAPREFDNRLIDMATQDISPEVRAVAARCLGTRNKKNDDRQVGTFLARITINSEEHLAVREAAYRALFLIAAIPIEKWPPLLDFCFPEQIEWNVLNRFLPAEERH